MNSLKKFFPFIPAKGEVGKFILGLIFYILLIPVGIPVGTIVLTFTIILILVVPVFVILLPVYALFGLVMVILGFCGALDDKKAKINE